MQFSKIRGCEMKNNLFAKRGFKFALLPNPQPQTYKNYETAPKLHEHLPKPAANFRPLLPATSLLPSKHKSNSQNLKFKTKNSHTPVGFLTCTHSQHIFNLNQHMSSTSKHLGSKTPQKKKHVNRARNGGFNSLTRRL